MVMGKVRCWFGLGICGLEFGECEVVFCGGGVWRLRW